MGVNKKRVEIPKFKKEDQEADWWASKPARDCVKQKSASARSNRFAIKGSRMIANLNKKSAYKSQYVYPNKTWNRPTRALSAKATVNTRS
jgi:hypothetical protein